MRRHGTRRAGARQPRGADVKIALTIAGSDSGGGAGIQADLKTFHQFGVFGTSVITAVTAQNTVAVRGGEPLPKTLVTQQLDALADDLPPQAVKSGMLGSADLVEGVAGGVGPWQPPHYLLDPRQVATSPGSQPPPPTAPAPRSRPRSRRGWRRAGRSSGRWRTGSTSWRGRWLRRGDWARGTGRSITSCRRRRDRPRTASSRAAGARP